MVARARERWRKELEPVRVKLEQEEKRRLRTPLPVPEDASATRCERCGKSYPADKVTHVPPYGAYSLDPDRPCVMRAVGLRGKSPRTKRPAATPTRRDGES